MNTLNTQIYDEATEWIILHRSDALDADARKRFDAWLRESPQHLRAYLEMSTIWEDVPALNRDWNPSADQLIARAREDTNVFPLGPKVPDTALPLVPDTAPVPVELLEASKEPELQSVPAVTISASQSTRMKLLAIAATVLMVVGVASWLHLFHNVYTTDIGEQRTIALNDGSTVELNAQTKIRIAYTDEERAIDLIQGQALFKVAKDPNRPFIVDSDGTRVRAVGTQFDVYKKTTGTQVTVVEGRVAVAPSKVPGAGDSGVSGLSRLPNGEEVADDRVSDTGDAQRASNQPAHYSTLQAHLGEILVSAGEQILIADATPTPELAAADPNTWTVPVASEIPAPTPPKVQSANIEAATAWTQQRLVFDFTPLTEVANEFNRYNRRRLVIEHATLSDFNVSGSFSSTDPTLLLRFLRDQPGIVVNETANEIRISRQEG